MFNSFRPDWSQNFTAEQAEKKLQNFKFQGPGFYYSDKKDDEGQYPKSNHQFDKDGKRICDTLIVVPFSRVPDEKFWEKSHKKDEVFVFCVYNDRDPMEMFQLILNAPKYKG